MFNVGDLIIYSTHGICQIDEVCEKTVLGVSRHYYVLHPLEDAKLTISTPVDNDKVVMMKVVNREEAEEILASFRLPGIDWIEAANERAKLYTEIVHAGHRMEIAKVINTLMRKQHEFAQNGKKLYEQDRKWLTLAQKILFAEIAIPLKTTYEAVYDEVCSLLNLQEVPKYN